MLVFGQNLEEFLKIGDASASDEVEERCVAVAWLPSIDEVFALRPRDTSHRGEPADEAEVRVNAVQQLNTVHRQRTHPSIVQRTRVAVLGSDICSSNYIAQFLLA